jgi:hypothetical protein
MTGTEFAARCKEVESSLVAGIFSLREATGARGSAVARLARLAGSAGRAGAARRSLALTALASGFHAGERHPSEAPLVACHKHPLHDAGVRVAVEGEALPASPVRWDPHGPVTEAERDRGRVGASSVVAAEH